MYRCLQLAKQGAGRVAPNPMVGAVLVYNNQVIGEGFHERFGSGHAEVNCIRSVHIRDQFMIRESTLYVSLEPCSHFGKTPPCTSLILNAGIPKVVIGMRDIFEKVNGKGIQILLDNNVEVISGILENECQEINRSFITFHKLGRPYIILKWAQTANKKIGSGKTERLLITNDLTKRLVHRWRSEEASIMAGTKTILLDNPQLSARHWSGPHPVRIVLDLELKLPNHLHVFDRSIPTIIFNGIKQESASNLTYYKLNITGNIVHQVVEALHQLEINSVLVEGGTKLLQSFIDADLWDEARVITNPGLEYEGGLEAPELMRASCFRAEKSGEDIIQYYHHHQF